MSVEIESEEEELGLENGETESEEGVLSQVLKLKSQQQQSNAIFEEP